MKSFLKNIISTAFSIILSIVVLMILLIIIISIGVSAIDNEKEIALKPNSILEINLKHPILDRSSANPFENVNFDDNDQSMELKEILDNIEKAKSDEKIRMIYLNISSVNAGLSQTEEIRNKLLEFKKTGKPIIAYAEVYSQIGYYISSVANKIYLNPQGNIELIGFSAQIMFYKELLKKLDIDIQVIRHGKFKSAIEPFVLEKMSKENRAQIELLLSSLHNNIFDSISSQRNLAFSEVERCLNTLALNTAEDCKMLGFVDGLVYEDELKEIMKEIISIEKIRLVSLRKYNNVKGIVNTTSKNKIAIIYATGEINSGKGNYNSIGSETTVNAIKKARENDAVKGIVFRINSPGGSALASDIILREVFLAKEKKPFVVSMGDYAASGGYYIACMADSIVANPTTITGSIGVFGMLPNLKKFYKNKLGISIDTVNTSKYADMGMNRKLTQFEYAKIRSSIKKIYDTFITHVSEGRGINKREVDRIAQGRVWSGYNAKDIGLIDIFGGIEKAIEITAELADIKEFQILSLPKKEDPFESFIKDLNIKNRFPSLLNLLGLEVTINDPVKDILTKDPIQARIPYIIELK